MTAHTEAIWSCVQSNYFYGVKDSFEVRADGTVWKASEPLSATADRDVWQVQGQLSAEALQTIKAYLQTQFVRLEAVPPVRLIPDDFPRVCRASLDGQAHQLEIYANSPPAHRQCLADLYQLIQSELPANPAAGPAD